MKFIFKNIFKFFLFVFLFSFVFSNVFALTSDEVTYDNEGNTEVLTSSLDTLYSELKTFKTGGDALANQMLKGKTAYVKGVLVTGTIESLAAAIYTPKTTDQVINSGVYLSGNQTIKGDANLLAANIKYGVSIFGVDGSFTGDANAAAAQILSGYSAYVKGQKINGSISKKNAATITPGPNDQTISNGQYLDGVQTILGDSNLKPENIVAGVTIFGVTGTSRASDDLYDKVSEGDYIWYVPTRENYVIPAGVTGINEYQTIHPNELKLWRVFKKNSENRTIEIIPNYISDQTIEFKGSTGYNNFIGVLNIAASAYETPGITSGSRHFGYDAQTEFIENNAWYHTTTGYWKCSTGEPCMLSSSAERKGGGDLGYENDLDTLQNIDDFGSSIISTPSGSISNYFVASRFYEYFEDDDWYPSVRIISEGNLSYEHMNYRNDDKNLAYSNAYSLLPIVYLRSGITALSGSGEIGAPWIVYYG